MDNEFRVFFTAKSSNEALARMMVAAFVSQYDPTISELTDMKTAVSEAVTNAIIHGYEREEGEVELYCGYQEAEKEIYLEIADRGRGIANLEQAMEPLYTSKPEMERSGMGFTIMEAFMDGIRVESTPDNGTRIFLRKKLSAGLG